MNTKRLTLLSMLFILLLGACRPATPAPGGTDTPAGETPPAQTAEGTTAAQPSSTPTLTPPPPAPQVILLAPDENGAPGTAQLGIIQPALERLADADALRFAALDPQAAGSLEGAQIVVGLPGVTGVADLARAQPEIQFVSLGEAGLQPGANLSVVQDTSLKSRMFFAAGYLGALTTTDWRVGALLLEADANDGALQAAFANGGAFFCGLCRPAFPPYDNYPMLVSLSSQAGEAEVQAAVDALVTRGVLTIFLGPDVGGETLYAYLAQKNVQVIGSAPPPTALADAWVGSLLPGWADALAELWPGLMAGDEGQAQDLPITIDHTSSDLLSPGRLRLLEETLSDLNSGYIDVAAPGP